MSKALGVYKIIVDETDGGDTRLSVLTRDCNGYDKLINTIEGNDADYIYEKMLGGNDV